MKSALPVFDWQRGTACVFAGFVIFTPFGSVMEKRNGFNV